MAVVAVAQDRWPSCDVLNACGGEEAARPPSRSSGHPGPQLRAPGLFPLRFEGLTKDICRGLSGRQVKRLTRDVRECYWALNWMHGEERRPAPAPDSGCPAKVMELQRTVQQRIEAACWQRLDAGCALSPEYAISKLRTGAKCLQ